MFSNKEKGTKFEDFVAYVYQSLLTINNCSSIVSKHVCINGLNGPSGEIDVYYEFEHLNLTYRVAIECKDWKNPIPAEEVRVFSTKIDNLNNVAGVMISTSGYQAGAIDFAKRHGIILMEEKDLPAFNIILADKIKVTFLPDEKTIGQPFWTLMEIRNGEVTGTYIDFGGDGGIPLLVSKKTAEEVLNRLPDKEYWCVRGLSQQNLRALIELAERFKWKVSYCPLPIEKGEILLMSIDLSILKEHYIW